MDGARAFEWEQRYGVREGNSATDLLLYLYMVIVTPSVPL
jgi:hypothetical protein